MKTTTQFMLAVLLLITSITTGQIYKDTIIEVKERKLNYEYNVRWSKDRLAKEIEIFKQDQFKPTLKSSDQITSLLNQIPLSPDPCRNGGFEDDYASWTGLSLKHSIEVLPIENGLILNPGIASLPFTGLSSGQNYTSIESTGLDPIISVASPSYPLQRTAPGTLGTKSLRLGNDQPGLGAEGVAKRFVVTAENAKYYFKYAIVMDKSHSDVGGVVNGSEVFFMAEAVDMSGITIDKVIDIANPTNPFINAVNNGSKYYRDWRCAYLDLSSKIGEEVVVMFINSDCARGAHKGYTYIDDVCKECKGTEGFIELELEGDGCINEKNTYAGNFDIPKGAVNPSISLDIYKSNSVVATNITPTIVSGTYTFDVPATTFPNQTAGTCYDLVAKLTFQLPDLNGNLQTVTQYSSNPVGGVQDGEISGINNDVCFCDNSQGAYCCEAENLVDNANFEAGNTGFTSDYSQTATTFPGEYNVTNTAANFGTTVTDHSFCADPVTYASNNKYLLVNGKTQQATSSTVWEQTLTGLEKGKTYKVCANFKNMPQCTFDILPEVTLEAGSSNTMFTVNMNPLDACAWQNETINFTATSNTETIKIILNETANGDGNDLAIDDIYVGELADPNLAITVEHDGLTKDIKGSLNSSGTTDDTLHGSCTEYHWYVAEITSYPSIVIDWNTFAHGNNTGSNLPPSASVPTATNWDLTTTFPGYTFSDNKMYIIGMYTPACECYDSGFTYQLTFNAKSDKKSGLTDSQQQAIIDAILNGLTPNKESISTEQRASVYPNPIEKNTVIRLQNDKIKSIKVMNITGGTIIDKKYGEDKNAEDLNFSKFANGIYIITTQGISGKTYTKKIIKQ
ncbi:T9SS type A sorting domain-containing protein [Polaribacter sp. Z014]|uniref:T9SS type A sorting domain-containing protein n=1 Tax=Polaribacter sp. Z014 TaxID=2927126 RepID=UPI002020F38F|nr:T9SS type A sorting domain-containing protein [Polaribacter sp. Z014]MCL7764872.1 T9SS type A sorting domain-containing protein [Polaribacter sp. Z014]